MSMTPASSRYFNQVAAEWDTIRSGYFGEAVREAAIARSYLLPGMVVADVGAGTGFIAAGLAPRVQRVHVIDGSPAMLEVARRNLAGFDNMVYHLGESSALPLPDASLDAVFANMVLHHCPDPLQAIREMVRLLKPGGRLVITDMDAHPHGWFKDEMADVWLGFERNQVRDWFKQADLVNVIVDCTGQSCCAQSQDPTIVDAQGREARVSLFVATGTRRLAMRDGVREAYSTAASSSGCGCSSGETSSCGCSSPGDSQASCCGEAEQAQSQGTSNATAYYTPEEIAAVPAEAGEFSLACGNPIAMAALRPGEVVLDIGSGGGLDSFLAASRVGPAGKVIGVDMTPAMLERARATAAKSNIQNVEFRQGQAEALPVDAGQVDVIISNCVINLVEDKGQVFQEAFRVLKPGGRLEVSDVVTSRPFPLDARANGEAWSGCVSGALPEQEYLDLISQAGFTAVQVRRSQAAGKNGDVDLYSAIVSAVKPIQTSQPSCGCG